MSETRRHTRASQCTGKIGFDSPALAHEVSRKRAARRQGKDRKREPRSLYRCQHCGKWHLGRESSW